MILRRGWASPRSPRNGAMMQRVLERDPSVAQFCRATGVSLASVWSFLSGARSPVRADGGWCRDAVRLAAQLDCDPEAVFGDVARPAPVGSTEFPPARTPLDETIERETRGLWCELASLVSERQARVLTLLYRDRWRPQDVARALGVTSSRVQQILDAALRRLRRPYYRARLREYLPQG